MGWSLLSTALHSYDQDLIYDGTVSDVEVWQEEVTAAPEMAGFRTHKPPSRPAPP